MSETSRKPWFVPKRYGYAALPSSRAAWDSTVIFIISSRSLAFENFDSVLRAPSAGSGNATKEDEVHAGGCRINGGRRGAVAGARTDRNPSGSEAANPLGSLSRAVPAGTKSPERKIKG
jgi:hypothetical protein